MTFSTAAPTEALLTTAELAALLGVSRRSVAKAVRQGRLPVARRGERGCGRGHLFRLSDVLAAVEARQ